MAVGTRTNGNRIGAPDELRDPDLGRRFSRPDRYGMTRSGSPQERGNGMRWVKTAATVWGILRGHIPRVSRKGWRGAVPPLTPQRQRRASDAPVRASDAGACRVARQSALLGPDAGGSGAPRRPRPRPPLRGRRG